MGRQRTSPVRSFLYIQGYNRYQHILLYITQEQDHKIINITWCFKGFARTGCMFAYLPEENLVKNNLELPIVVLMVSHRYRDEISYITRTTVHPRNSEWKLVIIYGGWHVARFGSIVGEDPLKGRSREGISSARCRVTRKPFIFPYKHSIS